MTWPFGCCFPVEFASALPTEVPSAANHSIVTWVTRTRCHCAIVRSPFTHVTVYFGIGDAAATFAPTSAASEVAVAAITADLFISALPRLQFPPSALDVGAATAGAHHSFRASC